MQEDNLKFLENFICNNKELQQLEKMFEKFNIFDCLKLSRQEIRHSNFLAWLLDPKETHGLGDYFIKEYLKIELIPFMKNLQLMLKLEELLERLVVMQLL